ncbi:MAG: GAF domain-containing sensor histidine kinase [Candidatus Eisenbacteria bacterium]|nr:GAF domain-containing sensor histidine kinase [Candidatus Eisenbacteria bacterium]
MEPRNELGNLTWDDQLPAAEDVQMKAKEDSYPGTFVSLEKSNIRYWVIVLLLMAAFATATALLYSTTVDTLRQDVSPPVQGSNVLVACLAAMVVLFCLYMIHRQTEFARLRGRLLSQRLRTETLKAQLEELSSLFDVSTSINLRLKLDGIIRIVVRRLPSCFAADRASLMMLDKSTGLLECKAAWGYGSNMAANHRTEPGEGIAGWVVANGRPLLLNGRELGRFSQFVKTEVDISSAMCVPIKLKNVTIGVLNVTRIRSKDRFTRKHLSLLCAFAGNIAGAIRKAHLYEEVSCKKTELEEDNRELASLNQMKEVFLATLSHELRTPLTCIVSFAEILDEKGSRLGEADRQHFVSIVNDQARKMLDLTEQIMDLSRLEKGTIELNLTETDLNEVVQSAYVAHAQTAAAKHIELRTELDRSLCPIQADSTKLRQIVLNLLGNAIKFTDEGGQVVVATRSAGERVEVSVSDTGAGMDADETSKIFGLFTRGSRQAKQSGLGLGLYLVKKFTELHNGEVTVESVKGKGSTFRVCLPAGVGVSDAAPAESGSAAQEFSPVSAADS